MKQSLKLVLPLLLAAAPAAAQEPTPPPKEGPVTRQTAVRDTPLLNFEYSWPEALSGQAQLVAWLNSDLSKSYDEALENARENKVLMDQNNGPFNQNMFNRAWTLEGQTERLVSLVSNTDTFTGGAHPNRNSSALLWERAAQREVKLADLFASPGGLDGAIRPQFCKLLDAERAKRRPGETVEGEFSECPALSELTVAPADKKEAGRFDTIVLIADPYVAGPYVEGEYEITIPVSAALVAALKAEHRGDFAAQPPQ